MTPDLMEEGARRMQAHAQKRAQATASGGRTPSFGRLLKVGEPDFAHGVALYLEDKDNRKDPDLWWLHVEKTEIHTPDSLDQRNQALYRFAAEHGLDAYDGMDVGVIE